jgi:predicted transcriptional regulator
MSRKPRDVTDAELAVLRTLWDDGEKTIREIADRLYPGGETSHYATVQKLLERLEEKRLVRRERGSAAHVFKAAVDRSHVIGRELQAMADKLCGGSLAPLLTHLVEAAPIGAEDRSRLREMVRRLAQSRRPKRRKTSRGDPE